MTLDTITAEGNALMIRSGAELVRLPVRFTSDKRYRVLTGYENTPGACWWCGSPTGLRRGSHYCRHHGAEYRRHFEWSTASAWAITRAGFRCENCGHPEGYQVHHIVPMEGGNRFYSARNLPWNLIVLCHDCHWALHRIYNMAGTGQRAQ